MFQDYLTSSEKGLRTEIAWIRNLDGVVRVPVFDPQREGFAYVVVYAEKRRSYEALAFDSETGAERWTQRIVNGGYGAPAVRDDQLIVLSAFTDVEALDSRTGRRLWRFSTKKRIRSAIIVSDGTAFFSSGGDVIGLDRVGKQAFSCSADRAFFFGAPVVLPDGCVLTLGCRTGSDDASHILLFAFSPNGSRAWEADLGTGSVASSDTSGILIFGDLAVVGSVGAVSAISTQTGRIIWSTLIDGIAHRQTCVTDGRRVFYTTVDGLIGALEGTSGNSLWQRHLSPAGIWSPPTVLGDRVLFASNGSLHLIAASDGVILQHQAVGQSPYSAVTVKGQRALFGGGDPPYFGLLFGFRLVKSLQKDFDKEIECVLERQNRLIEGSRRLDLVLRVHGNDGPVDRIVLDLSSLGLPQEMLPDRQDGSSFIFEVDPKPGYRWGTYALPVTIECGGSLYRRSVLLELHDSEVLPVRTMISDLPPLKQELQNWSGAACMAAVRALYGDQVEQSEMRRMVDEIRAIAPGYLPFDTWRLITRRALSSSSHSVEELPEFRADGSVANFSSRTGIG